MATTDTEGRFSFGNVEPGNYGLNADRAGFASIIGIGQPPPMIELGAGMTRDDVVITLQRGGAIAGRVVDARGEAVPGLRVMAMRQAPLPPRAAPNRPPLQRLLPASSGGQTDDLGEFRVASLAPGEYYVQVSPGFSGPFGSSGPTGGATINVPTYFPGTTDSAGAQSVAVSAGQTTRDIVIHIQTAAGFGISGIVSDEGGRPVANAMVRVMPQAGAAIPFGPPTQAKSDSQGRFSIGSLISGTYTVVAVPPSVSLTGASSSGSFGSVTASASGSGFTSTETFNGVTTQYRDSDGARLPIVVSGEDVVGVQLVVHRVQ